MAVSRKALQYTIAISYDRAERVYNVSVPSLPGCHSWGRTKRDAVRHVREAIQVYLETLADAGMPIPADDVELRILKLA